MLKIFSIREIVILILYVLYFVFFFEREKEYKKLKCIKCNFKNLILPIILLIMSNIAIFFIMYLAGAWNSIYIKFLVGWIVIVGLPVFINRENNCSEVYSFTKEIGRVFKLTILIEFVLNIGYFPFFLELIIIPVSVMVYVIKMMAPRDITLKMKNMFEIIYIVITTIEFVEVIILVDSILTKTWIKEELLKWLLPIISSILLVFICYITQLVKEYKKIFDFINKVKMTNSNIKVKDAFGKIFILCHISLVKLYDFDNFWESYNEKNVKEIDKCINEYKNINEQQTDDIQKDRAQKQVERIEISNKIEYMNKHAALLTLLVTSFAGIGLVLLKGFIYVFRCGEFDYWGINHIYINVSNENVLYEMVLHISIIIIYIAICSIPYLIIKSRMIVYEKIKQLRLFSCILAVLMCAILYLDFDVEEYISDQYFFFACYIIAWVLGVIFSVLGILMLYACMPQNGEFTFSGKNRIILLVICIAVYMILAYLLGKQYANNRREFKFINQNQIVIFENSEQYIVAEYEQEGKDELVIKTNIQQIMSKVGEKTETRFYNNVSIEKENNTKKSW